MLICHLSYNGVITKEFPLSKIRLQNIMIFNTKRAFKLKVFIEMAALVNQFIYIFMKCQNILYLHTFEMNIFEFQIKHFHKLQKHYYSLLLYVISYQIYIHKHLILIFSIS